MALVKASKWQKCCWRGWRGEGEWVRASYFGLMRVDTAALFYGLLKRTSDKGPSITDVRTEGEGGLAEKQTYNMSLRWFYLTNQLQIWHRGLGYKSQKNLDIIYGWFQSLVLLPSEQRRLLIPDMFPFPSSLILCPNPAPWYQTLPKNLVGKRVMEHKSCGEIDSGFYILRRKEMRWRTGLPGFACSIHATWGPSFSHALCTKDIHATFAAITELPDHSPHATIYVGERVWWRLRNEELNG